MEYKLMWEVPCRKIEKRVPVEGHYVEMGFIIMVRQDDDSWEAWDGKLYDGFVAVGDKPYQLGRKLGSKNVRLASVVW